jgi:MFS-type transporter involved in bile tolerance (Atg22 family)
MQSMTNEKWKRENVSFASLFSFLPDFGIIITPVILHLKLVKREVAIVFYDSAVSALSSRDVLGKQSLAPFLF